MNDELDDMKQLWQNTPAAASTLDEQHVLTLISTRSKSALEHLRKNMLIETGFAVLVIIFLTYRTFTAPTEQVRFALIQLTLLLFPLFLFYYFGLQNLKRGISFTGNLKTALTESVAFWERALRLYFWGGLMLLPIIVIALIWYRMGIYGPGNALFFTGSTWVILTKFTVFIAVIAVIVWVLIRISYGVYVDRLKKCLKELEGAA